MAQWVLTLLKAKAPPKNVFSYLGIPYKVRKTTITLTIYV